MAVWFEVCGKNGLLDEKLSHQDYLDVLNDIPLDTAQVIRSIVESGGPVPLNSSLRNDNVLLSRWGQIEAGFFGNKVGYQDVYDGLRIYLVNDLIFLSGPRRVFSYPTYFTNLISPKSRGYYHLYFKSILRAFKSDKIFYGCLDFDPGEATMEKVMGMYDWESSSSKSINDISLRYYEQL